jgi:hypothetical protein
MLRAVRRICPHEILANFGPTRLVVLGHERRLQREAHLSHTASPPTVDSCVDRRIYDCWAGIRTIRHTTGPIVLGCTWICRKKGAQVADWHANAFVLQRSRLIALDIYRRETYVKYDSAARRMKLFSLLIRGGFCPLTFPT